MNFDYDSEGVRLPIKVDTASNGEFSPIALTKVQKYANKVALESTFNPFIPYAAYPRGTIPNLYSG